MHIETLIVSLDEIDLNEARDGGLRSNQQSSSRPAASRHTAEAGNDREIELLRRPRLLRCLATHSLSSPEGTRYGTCRPTREARSALRLPRQQRGPLRLLR